jgi:lon-related putative ATP-dependent protease
MSGLKPEPIPIDIKVILVGSNLLFQLLHQLDEDFGKLFKVKVDFDDEMEANEHNVLSLAKFISGYCRRENLRHFSKDAVLSVADYACRLVESQEKFSTRFNDIVEILVEANTWAEIAGNSLVTARDVKRAIAEKEYRSNKYDEKLMELLEKDIIMVKVDGEAVGQINGLSVIHMGDYIFGKPSKITATTFMGRSGIVNIEREVEMSGNVHSKGVMILSAYIGEQYAQEIPLALSANITFEQLYIGVEGDSASSAELYAILSSLAEVPIKQGIAVTGSINQKGEIQPVGGVTYKIEGFFQLCKARGLTGEQGVIIPYQNIKNLVLKDEVIKAVEEGKFHIYPIKHVDEGIEILMGLPAGKKLENGFFEKDTVHEKVYNKLRHYALTMINFGKSEEDEDKKRM